MVSNFNSIISKIKNAYQNSLSDFCVKNFRKSELILKKLRTDGFIRGFSVVDKKTLKIFLSYTKTQIPSMTAAIPATSIRRRNLIGCFNINRISRDFNVFYVNDSMQKMHSIKSKKMEYNKISQGIFLLK